MHPLRERLLHPFLAAAFVAGALCVLGPPATAAPNAATRDPATATVAEGVLEVIVEDHQGFARTRHFLKTSRGRLELTGMKDRPTLVSGARVRVRGRQTGTVLALASGDTASTTLVASAPAASTFGEQKLGVLLVNFSDDTSQPYTLAQIADVVFNQTSAFVKENSFQATWITGNVYGWFTLPVARTCDGITIASYAYSAATNAGVDLTPYAKLAYVMPYNSNCGWNGGATLGGASPNIWVNGTPTLQVFGHEFGHTLGLYHAHALECGTGVQSGTCQTLEYGDEVDIMGNNTAGHYDAFNKERLGWIGGNSAAAITTVQQSGSFTLGAYSAGATTQPKALKILKSVDPTTGARTWYYVEYRQAVGYDAALSNIYASNLTSGVLVRSAGDADGNSGLQLDMTPASSPYYDWADSALAFGRSFTDATAGVTISAVAGNGSTAQVDVTLAAVAGCVRANPSLSLTGGGQAVAAGTPVTYTLTLTNNDSAGCGSSTFSLQPAVPTGWTAGFAAGALSASAGGAASTSMTVTSAATTASGTYSVGALAANAAAASYVGQVSVGYSVGAGSLSTSVSTSQAAYNPGDTVVASTRVMNGSSPAAKASVTFTFVKANGSTVTKSTATDSSGVAKASYRIGRKDPKGNWQVDAAASLGSQSANGASAFTVQ